MKIGYSKTYPIIGKETWEKNWLEDEINLNLDLVNCTDGEIAKAMLNVRKIQYALKKQVESFHYESNKAADKQLYPEKFTTQYEAEIPASLTDQPVTVSIKTPDEKIIEQIESTTDIKVLHSFELLAKKYPTIKEAYDNKLKQLTA